MEESTGIKERGNRQETEEVIRKERLGTPKTMNGNINKAVSSTVHNPADNAIRREAEPNLQRILILTGTCNL